MKPPEGETPIERCVRLAKERDALDFKFKRAIELLERLDHLVVAYGGRHEGEWGYPCECNLPFDIKLSPKCPWHGDVEKLKD